jgi:hypothetical protein
MLNMKLFHNAKGISLVESMIAVFLTMIAVVSLMPMQTMSMRTVGKSDLLGRASGIMQSELERKEFEVMRTGLGLVPTGSVQTPVIGSHDVAGVLGDANFLVTTTTMESSPVTVPKSYIVNVRVTWPGNSTGVASSVRVAHQSNFDLTEN